MYTAKIEGQSIDVDDISISFRLKNPMFDDNAGMDWSTTYPFKLPNTPRNRFIFGFPHRTSLKDKHVKDYSFEHFFSGIRLPGDTIRVTYATTGEIEAYVKIGRSDFVSLNKNKLLSQLNFPVVRYYLDPNSLMWVWDPIFKEQKYPDIPFALCTVKNDSLFDNTHVASWWIDPAQNNWGPYQNMYYEVSGVDIFTNERAISPFPFVASVIDQIFKECNYAIKENFFTSDDELKSLCIYNPNIEEMFGPNPGEYFDITPSNHLPGITIPEFFIRIRVPFGVDFYFNNYNREVRIITRKQVITSTDVVDISNNVLPELKVAISDVILAYKFSLTSPGNDAYFDSCVKDFSDYIDFPYTVYGNLSELPLSPDSGNIAYVLGEDNYYIAEYDFSLETIVWRLITHNLLPMTEGDDPELIVESEVGVVINEFWDYAGDYTPAFQWATPVVMIPGNMNLKPLTIKSNYEDFGLTLLFNRGLSFTSNGYIYPLGSSFRYDYYDHVVGDPQYSLRWDGDQQQGVHRVCGLYRRFWREWIAWRKKTQLIEFTKAFTAFEIFNLDFSKKHFALNKVLILEEINFTVTNRSIKPAKVKAWTV